MSNSLVAIALLQASSESGIQGNVDKTLQLIRKAAEQGAQIICTQELFTTPYFCREINEAHFDLAESVPGPTTDQLCEEAKKLGVVIVASLFEKRGGGIYHNTGVVIDADGTYMGKYRKMHIPDDPGFYEKFYFTPGDTGYKVFKTRFGTIGLLICWDQWYPEAARLTAMKGADILIYPTAIATLPEENTEDKQEFFNAWQIMQQSHAIANGCYVASINRVGNEEGMCFWGGSFVCGPFGHMISQGGDDEEVIIAKCDFTRNEKQRRAWPFFRDRRIDTYKPITKRFLD